MKKSFSFNLSLFIRYFIVSAVLISIDLLFPLKFIKELSPYLVAPLNLVVINFTDDIKEAIQFGQSLQYIFSENNLLRTQIGLLKGELTEMEKVKEENDFLKSQLNIAKNTPYSYVLADLRGWQPDSFGRNIVINKGSQDGITIGMPVVTQNYVIGIVQNVDQRNATVEVISSPQSFIPAMITKIGNSDRVDGIAEGDFGFQIKLVQIPQDAKVAAGDLVVTSGKGGSLPQGLIVGEVESVSQGQNEVYQEARVVPLINLDRLDRALVILQTQF